MPASDYLANSLANHVFNDPAFAAPTVYVGFSSTTPTTAGTNVTEPSGGGYARQQVAPADMEAAGTADVGTKRNSSVIDFGTASADWAAGANLTHHVFYDAASGGNFLGFAAISTPQPVLSGNPVQIPVNGIDWDFQP